MPYYEIANIVTVTKTNMIDEMPCAYGTLRTTALRIRHQVSRRAAQRSQLLEVCMWLPDRFTFRWCTQWTHSNIWSQLATSPQCSFAILCRQSEKNQQNCDCRAICNATCGIGAGRRGICHRGVSDSSDLARPLWSSHSARTEMFFADAGRCKFVLPTLGVVTNIEGSCASWSCSCPSVHSSLSISAYRWNIYTWSTKYLVSHHSKWWTSRETGYNCITQCAGSALGRVFSGLFCSRRSVSQDAWSSSG